MKILAKIKKRPLVLGILFAMLIIGIVYAAESYKVNSGATSTIDEHGVCKKVTNNNSLAIFVPTKTAAEWTAFRTYASGVTYAGCICAGPDTGWGDNTYGCVGTDKRCYNGSCITCGGWMNAGYCWYRADLHESCTSACSSRGGVYQGNCEWINDPSDCSTCRHWFPGDKCEGESLTAPFWYRATPYDEPYCTWHYNRITSNPSDCDWAYSGTLYRFCACNW